MTELCCDCNAHARTFGARCVHCYVRVHFKRAQVWDLVWVQQNYETFAMALAGRIWAMQCGQEPGDVEHLLKVATAHNGVWKKTTRNQREILMRIINAAEKLAGGKKHA